MNELVMLITGHKYYIPISPIEIRIIRKQNAERNICFFSYIVTKKIYYDNLESLELY